jgi:hypothetical protein
MLHSIAFIDIVFADDLCVCGPMGGRRTGRVDRRSDTGVLTVVTPLKRDGLEGHSQFVIE